MSALDEYDEIVSVFGALICERKLEQMRDDAVDIAAARNLAAA